MNGDNIVALRPNGGPIINRHAMQGETAAITVKNARSVVLALLHADPTGLEDEDRSNALWVVHGLLSDAIGTLEPEEPEPTEPDAPEGGAA